MKPHNRYVLTVAFAVVLCLSCCSAKKPNGFADFLAGKLGTGQGKVLQYDDYTEVEEACLKEMAFKNCRTPNGAGLNYFESGVTCCDGRSNSGNSLGSSATEVGNCKFNEYMFEREIEEAPGVSKMGEFTVQCYLNAASETCGGPFCEQMVLTASGGIYYTDDIVLASRPISPIVDSSCGDGGKRDPKLGSRVFRGKKMGKIVGAKASIASTGTEASLSSIKPAEEKSLYSGEAVIYFGPMTVNSRFHAVKYTQGWFEYAYDYTEGEPISEADAEGKHIIDPFTYSTKFYKPSNY